MPDDVRQAKRIEYKIGKKAELSDGTEEFHLEDGFKNSNEHEQDITNDQRRSTPTTHSTVQSTIQSTTSSSITKDTPPPAAPQADHSGSTITPTKRSYTSRVQTQSPFPGGDRFPQTYQMSLQQDELYQEREA